MKGNIQSENPVPVYIVYGLQLIGYVLTGCVDLSYPNLHYISYIVAHDMEVHHSQFLASLDVRFRATLPGSVSYILLDYVKLSNCASSIHFLDANDKKPWFPFSDDDNLYQKWRQLLVVPKDQVPRLLVAIPRGGNSATQIMTATVVLMKSGTGKNMTVGIRWLHCQ